MDLEVPELLSVMTQYDLYTKEKTISTRVQVNLNNDLLARARLRFEIRDSQGKEVSQKVVEKLAKKIKTDINISTLEDGDYKLITELKTGKKTYKTSNAFRKLPPVKSEVKVDHFSRMTVVNGKPFFPMGIYLEGNASPECIKYYANILTPFSPMVTKKINEVLSLNLPLDMICPSHGMIWRDRPEQIVEQYLKWADNYQENQITVIYDTMWNGTRKIAESIVKGIRESDKEVEVKLYHLEKRDKNDVITEVFKSKGIIIGSPTVNKGVLTSVAAILELIKGLKFKEKKAAAFGCHGWSGESAKNHF